MQAASGTLLAAIQSKERQPVQVVKADWARNGTFVCYPGTYNNVYNDIYGGVGDIGTLQSASGAGWVESCDVSRSLSTDLPESSKQAEGFAAADATVALAGDTLTGSVPLEKVFGAFGNSMSQLAPRIGAPITIDMGQRGTAGVEVLRQFTGKVRGCSVDPGSGNVTLTCIDRRESFRTPVTLPVVVADDFATSFSTSKRPGLNAQWMLDYIARAQGIYASPPVRASCAVSATLHGSTTPEVGTQTLAYRFDWTSSRVQGPALFAPPGTGLTALHDSAGQMLGATCTSRAIWAPTVGLSPDQNSTVLVEYHKVRVNSAALPAGHTVNILQCYAGSIGSTTQLGIRHKFGTTRYEIRVNRAGADSGYVDMASISFTDNVEHYAAFHITFTAAGFDARVRINGTTSSVHSGVCGNPTGNAALGIVLAESTTEATQTESSVWLSGLQVTTEAFTSTMFNDAFVPSAVFEVSQNELTATPAVDMSDPWDLAQQIAVAEQGIFGFDELGVLRFYNRDHMTGGAAVATITSAPSVAFANLKAAASDEQVDGVANYVTVGAVPVVLDPPNTLLWTLGELIGVPALTAITIPIEFPAPMYQLQAYNWTAAKAADGTGGDVLNIAGSATTVSTTGQLFTFYNPNAFDAFMVGNSTVGTPGDPYFLVTGQCLRPAAESGYTAIRTSQPSATLYGLQTLDVPANVWRQSKSAADGLADDLLTALAYPHPVLSAVEVVSDVRLQLGDRVRVADPTGLVLDQDFWITSLSVRHSGSDTGQTVGLRQT